MAQASLAVADDCNRDSCATSNWGRVGLFRFGGADGEVVFFRLGGGSDGFDQIGLLFEQVDLLGLEGGVVGNAIVRPAGDLRIGVHLFHLGFPVKVAEGSGFFSHPPRDHDLDVIDGAQALHDGVTFCVELGDFQGLLVLGRLLERGEIDAVG